nr:hypothetical protein [Muriicola soli]
MIDKVLEAADIFFDDVVGPIPNKDGIIRMNRSLFGLLQWPMY